MKFIEKIQKIDDSMRFNFEMNIDYWMYKVLSLLALSIVVVYYNVVVTVVMYFFLLDISSVMNFLTFATYVNLSATSGIFTYGFVGYVILIRRCLIKFNESLGKVVKFPPEELEKQYKTKDALCKEMMRYTKIYKTLCSGVDDINQIYGSSMVLQFAHDFTLLTTQIFAMFYIGFYEHDPTKSFIKIIALIVWMMPNVLKISFTCFTCHMARNEVCRTFLSEILN